MTVKKYQEEEERRRDKAERVACELRNESCALPKNEGAGYVRVRSLCSCG